MIDVLNADLPNLVQMDVSLLSGLLAERLLAHIPNQEKVFFCNSGTEAVEAAIKLARAATAPLEAGLLRPRLPRADHGRADHQRRRIVPRRASDHCWRTPSRVPWNDLEALEAALAGGDVAAFFVEPIQGKGVNLPGPGYLLQAARLCKKHGALFVVDEVQTGLGRTGRFLAIEHEDVDPDLVLLAKALSGGFVPVGAVVGKKWIFDRLFNRMDRAVVHGSTFGKNNLAMAAGLATLAVLEDEELIENAGRRGESLVRRLGALVGKYELLKEVRGRGLDGRAGVRPAAIAGPARRLGAAGEGDQGAVLPDGDHPAVHAPPHPVAGRRATRCTSSSCCPRCACRRRTRTGSSTRSTT